MAKIAFWITAGLDQEAKALSGIMLASRLKSQRNQDVQVYFFGPGVELAGKGSERIQEGLKALREAGVPAGACGFNAQQFSVEPILDDRGIYTQPAGEVMIKLVEEGYQIVGF